MGSRIILITLQNRRSGHKLDRKHRQSLLSKEKMLTKEDLSTLTGLNDLVSTGSQFRDKEDEQTQMHL